MSTVFLDPQTNPHQFWVSADEVYVSFFHFPLKNIHFRHPRRCCLCCHNFHRHRHLHGGQPEKRDYFFFVKHIRYIDQVIWFAQTWTNIQRVNGQSITCKTPADYTCWECKLDRRVFYDHKIILVRSRKFEGRYVPGRCAVIDLLTYFTHLKCLSKNYQ